MKNENIAKVCHEVNRAYSAAIGDFDTVPWEEAPKSQVESCLTGVAFHLENEHNPEESHESWMKQKEDDGWIFGEEKDEELKTHPCMVPYEDLPVEQKAKDFIFAAIVNAMAGMDVQTVVETALKDIKVGGSVQDISKTVTSLVPVKYVGRRNVYTDGTCGTGLTFVKGETKLITPARAAKMLKHKGVYILGEMVTEVATKDAAAEDKVEESDEVDETVVKEQLIQGAKDSIMNMKTKAPIMEFAARNFSGVNLDNKHTVADLQQEAIQMIDQFGLVN